VQLNVASTGATLKVLGDDDAGESALTYTWELTSFPINSTTTLADGNSTNAAKTLQVTFTRAGDYTFKVTVQDADGLTTSSTVNITVDQVLTQVTVTPNPANVSVFSTTPFTAVASDQFGQPMTAPFTWSATGGTIESDGSYTAGNANGNYTVTATTPGFSASAQVTITSGVPAAPSNVAAVPKSPNSARVTWQLNGDATNIYVMRWNKTAWMQVAKLAGNATSFVEYGLATGGTYYYHVIAANALGGNWATNFATVTTLVASAAPPAAPTSLAATPLTSSSVRVNWNVAGDETSVVLKRWTGTVWVNVATLAAGTTSYTVTGLAANTQYYFDVVALNASGGTWAAMYAGAKTFAAAPPPAPTDLAFTQLSSTSGSVSWTLHGNETAVYVAKWTGTKWQIVVKLAAGTTSYVDSSLFTGASAYYMIITENAFGKTWAASYVTGTIV
jgi:hypothetical protein